MSHCAPAAAISPFIKGVKQSIDFGISAQSDFFCSVNQVHAWTSLPKQTMTSSEHHMMMS